MFFKTILSSVVFIASTTCAFAQTTPTSDDAVASAKNQLGILEYCHGKGYVDASAVDTQTKLIGMLPPATDTAKIDAAYKKGQSGIVSSMGQEMSLPDASKNQGTTEEAMCKQIGSVVAQAAASLPK